MTSVNALKFPLTSIKSLYISNFLQVILAYKISKIYVKTLLFFIFTWFLVL